MSRTAWFVAGAGAGVYALTRARRAAEVLTPDGLADRLAGLTVGLRMFRDEVRTGTAEKETDLRERLGVPLHGTPRLSAAPPLPDHAGTPADPTETPDTREGHH